MNTPRIEGPESQFTVNESLLDSAILHAHAVERFKGGLSQRILRFLNEDVYPDIADQIQQEVARIATRGHRASERRLKRLERLYQKIDELTRTGMRTAYGNLRQELLDFGRVDATWQVDRLKRAANPFLDFEFDLPAPGTLRSLVLSRPFQGKILREHWGTLTRNTRETIKAGVRQGMAQGESVDQIVRRVRGRARNPIKGPGAFPQSRREVRTIVRTAINHVSAHTREETFRQNGDVVKGVRYVATLDSRTSDICASLDGRQFAIDRGPRPPMHHQCRSTVVPILKSWKELGINLREAPPTTRASMSGQVPGDLTYGQWLRRQPAALQDEALGPARAELFRGGLSIDKFVDSNFRTLTLAELERIAN